MPFLEDWAFGCLPDSLEVGKDSIDVNVGRGANMQFWRYVMTLSYVRESEMGDPPEKSQVLKRLAEPRRAVIIQKIRLDYSQTRGERVDEWCLVGNEGQVGILDWLFLIYLAKWRRVGVP